MFGLTPRQGSASSTTSLPTTTVQKGALSGTEYGTALQSAGMPLKAADRKKLSVVAMRKWVKVDANGESSVIQADKSKLTQELGVQLRDLRLLDPQLSQSYPSAILSREKALVVNLEHIKCIITTDQVLILNADEERVVAFIEDLQRRLQPASPARGSPEAAHHPIMHAHNASAPELADGLLLASGNGLGMGNGGGVGMVNGTHIMGLPKSRFFGGGSVTSAGASLPDGSEAHGEVEEMPFELRALEVVLDTVCGYLERLTEELEAAAHPALDALTKQVTTHNLERVRRIKNRMVRLNTRVETIHELLEKLLDDDSDMRDMNLTAKQQEDLERAMSAQRQASLDMAGLAELAKTKDDSDDEESEIAAVEMVLEAYFMHIDNTYNKLQTLTEYIDDTEDYINIELDNHRNQLIRVELILTAGTFSVALVGVIAGIFGMNLNNRRQDSYTAFTVVSVVSSVGAILIFIGVIMWCRYKKILG